MQAATFSLALLSVSALLHGADFRCHDPSGGVARCVIISGAPLTHTAQIMTPQERSLTDQISATLAKVDAALKSSGSSLAQIVKLNVYVTRDRAAAEVEAALATAFNGDHKPAVSFVTARLPAPDALVAMDAVGIADRVTASSNSGADFGGLLGDAAVVLPIGARVYVSGQAEKGDGTLADATRQTLASLGRTLEFLGLSKSDVVQVKSFLTPISKWSEAGAEIARFFHGARVPPCVFVEWQSTLPIEIEMIVAAGDNAALASGPSVEVRTPPGMTAPAVYSRLTIARHPATIYTSSLYPNDSMAPPETQLRSLFSNLKQCLDLTGSDWMHLVKATYYVSNDELSRQHNLVRPDYFSPRRPPAASKATVAGTGRPGHGITMDFIAVPGEP